MVSMMVRPLSDNRPFRASASVNVGLGDTLGATFETPMMTELMGRSIELGQARGQSLYELDVDLESELLSLQDQALDMPQGPDRDALQIRMTEITRQMRQGGTERGRQMAIEEGRVIAPEVLQQQYGHMDLTFNRPMTEEEARIIVDGRREEMIREAIIAAGPRGVVPTIARFGVGVLAMATDPLEVASMFIPVVSQARTAMLIDKFGRVGGRAAVGAIEGFVGSALTEPAYYGMSRELQLDYTMADSLFNIGLGTILGGGIGSVAGVLSRQQSSGAAPEFRVDVDMRPERTPEVARPMDVETYRAMEAQRQDVAMQRPVAETALRQFVNDTPVSVREMLPDVEALRAELRAARQAEVDAMIEAPKAMPGLASFRYRDGVRGDAGAGAKTVEDAVESIKESVGGRVSREEIRANMETWNGREWVKPDGPLYFKKEGERFQPQVEAVDRLNEAQRQYWNAELTHEAVTEAERAGYTLTTLEQAQAFARAMRQDIGIEEFAKSTGMKSDKQLADEAASLNVDSVSDAKASERLDAEPQRPDDELMAELEMIYDGMADDLTPEQRRLVEDADAQSRHADDYARAVEMGAMCLAGGRG